MYVCKGNEDCAFQSVHPGNIIKHEFICTAEKVGKSQPLMEPSYVCVKKLEAVPSNQCIQDIR